MEWEFAGSNGSGNDKVFPHNDYSCRTISLHRVYEHVANAKVDPIYKCNAKTLYDSVFGKRVLALKILAGI